MHRWGKQGGGTPPPQLKTASVPQQREKLCITDLLYPQKSLNNSAHTQAGRIYIHIYIKSKKPTVKIQLQD